MRYLFALLLSATAAMADAPQVTAVDARSIGADWSFSVTLTHPDTGWDHYADGWRVELEDGTVLGTRELAHPHVTEQPFTRSLGGVAIPDGVQRVFVRARCNLDGWNEEAVAFDLP